MSEARLLHILIAGAGIGGLTAALALAQTGARVDVFEQSLTLGDVGAGIQLSPNAMHVMAKLGLEAALVEAGFEPDAATLRDYKTGNPEITTSFKPEFSKRYGQKYLHVHRADLHHILLDTAEKAGAHVNLDLPVSGYVQSKDHVTLKSGDKSFDGDVLIGADGIHSVVRKTMLGARSPTFTGQVAWRGLVPTSAVPKGLIPHHANAWLGPGKHFVAYYVRGGELINFVAVEERTDWAKESWNTPGDMAAVRTAFSGWDARVTTLLDACDQCYLWGLFDREPLERWTDGRVTLVGDACHPMLPFMAQGAAMAIEDAYVLAHSLSHSTSIENALSGYEKKRKTRTTKIQSISRENAKLFHLRSPLLRLNRKAQFKIAKLIPAAAYLKFDPIYKTDVTDQ